MRYSALLFWVGLVNGHGKVTSPPAREPGTAMLAACGQQVYNNQASNDQGNVQNEVQVAASQTDYNAAECNLSFCKGYMFADNQANVQTFTPGQTVNIVAEISAPHTGTCNVSVVGTKTNSLLSDSLIYFSDYASNSHTIPANNTNFSIKMPTNLGSQCAKAGNCVVQWFWNAADIKQTYESCIDFTMSGSGSGTTAAAGASAPATTSATASSGSGATTSGDDCDAEPASNTASTAKSIATATVGDDCRDDREDDAAAAKIRRHAKDFDI